MTELDSGAAFVVVTEEALTSADLHPLAAWLADQQEWSDLPFILLTNRGGGLERNPAAARFLDVLGNVTFLERPFHPTSLVSLARSALRGRRRQYEARARLIDLRESELRYRTLFDTMDEAFCVIRFLDGPQDDYLITQANPAYQRHTGIAQDLEHTARQRFPAEADRWIPLFREVLRTGVPQRFELAMPGAERILELAAFRVEPASRREVALIFQDVTDRRSSELKLRELNETLERRVEEAIGEREVATAQLHEAQKLEMIGQLTGGVAHDINNLLTPITGALDVINRRYAEQDPRAARLLDGALQSAERAKILVNRLLGFARRQTLETRPVDIEALLEGMRDLVTSSVGANIEVRMEAAGDGLTALADPNQLELAILNLCVNARDAMVGGGVLTISAKRLRFGPDQAGALRPGSYVRVRVSDTGTGMSPATLAKAVEPFFSTKGIGKGTGLGLSMVHGLAAQLGGKFELSSKAGEGTHADLYLPVAEEAARALKSHLSGPLAELEPLSILLVDDEDLVRTGTADMLRELGHTVHEAAGGAQALALIAKGAPIDALITDYMMPRMSGAELAERALAQRPDLPVLIVTGYAGGDLELSLPQLAKPFRQSDLIDALARVVRKAGRGRPQPPLARAAG
ncbi:MULTISPECIES: ATP-binding protein [Sphingomonas]|uniref:ATP-binding protein n=1 Tax=Sphingomonas TaxID=13687 RepID=UPI001F07FC58|nr:MULTISPECIES: ATP-binding protein [Sphingomonas]